MKTRIAVRPFRPREMDRILEIERACFRQDAYDRKLFAAYANHPNSLFLVAARGSEIDGYSIARWREARSELTSIAVDPEVRRRGVASLLLKSTIRRLKLRGSRRLTLMVKITNRSAQRFYVGHGFTFVRVIKGYYEDGRDGLLMGKDL